MPEIKSPSESWPPSVASSSDAVSVRNVLLPTDFSESSARALDYAVGIASRYEAAIHLFHCVDPALFNLTEESAEIQTACDDVRRNLEKLADSLNREHRARPSDVRVTVTSGNLAAILPQVIEDLHIDLIIVGTHGRTGWKKLVLGSVAEIVIDGAPCPVLSVAPSTSQTRLEKFGPKKILLAVAASDETNLSKSYALSLARKYGSRLSVVDVLEECRDHVIATFSQSEWYESAPDPASSTQPRITSQATVTEIGTRSDLILRIAVEREADLIVLPVPASHRFTDRFLSSNSYRVVSAAPCPVLTVHSQVERDPHP